jgi:hypothetical protein
MAPRNAITDRKHKEGKGDKEMPEVAKAQRKEPVKPSAGEDDGCRAKEEKSDKTAKDETCEALARAVRVLTEARCTPHTGRPERAEINGL